MRKVNLVKIFESKGGIIRIPACNIPYRMNGNTLEANLHKNEDENYWVSSFLNTFNGFNGFMPVREFEKMFGFTPKKEFIENI